jgi:hypothetical protein
MRRHDKQQARGEKTGERQDAREERRNSQNVEKTLEGSFVRNHGIVPIINLLLKLLRKKLPSLKHFFAIK